MAADTEHTSQPTGVPGSRVAPLSPDLARPLLAQVGAQALDYETWVHKSISPRSARQANGPLIEAGDRVATRWPDSLRLFRAAPLEALSHVAWWVVPLIWVPVIVALFVASHVAAGLAWLDATWAACAGVALWTLTEYALHRFVFHYQPRGAFGRKLHFLGHGIHHLDPWDPTRLVFPPVPAFLVAGALFGLLRLALPLPTALATMSGLLVGYVIYDLTHYATHHVRPRTRWGKFLKAWHLAHHHKWPRRLYGVSSPLWDLILRTGRPPKSPPVKARN